MTKHMLLFVTALVACAETSTTPIDAMPDALDRCTDACPVGMLCANGRCKRECPGPGGIGETCGVSGSICCGLGATCVTGGAIACTDACSPFDSRCPSGFGCHIMSTGTQSYTDCREAGAGTQGASCASSAECAPGFYCIGGTTPMCVRYCLVDDASHGCDALTTCHPHEFFEHVLYGICY